MTARELREKFITFFENKGHKRIPSAPLMPENDSSTLFISAGIQPLVQYFLGKKHPSGTRLVNVQKCIRTVDIDNVGNATHHTLFEMLGNWSLDDYFKSEMIPWSLELLTKHFGYDKKNLHVTCFAGDSDAPKDEVTANLWKQLGIPETRVHFLPKEDNWWGPPGITGPCGPDSEMFIDTTPDLGDVEFKQGYATGRYVEIGNDVFIQYLKNSEGKYEKLVQDNIDTGYGIERNLAILNHVSDNYLTDIWQPIIKTIEDITQKKYQDIENQKPMRIIADHVRAAVFIIADGVEPANKEAGYVLRRLIRRAVRQGSLLGVDTNFLSNVATSVLANQNNYAGDYPELNQNHDKILTLIEMEEKRFRLTLDKGLKEIEKIIYKLKTTQDFPSKISNTELGSASFFCYETYGFPFEMSLEEFKNNGITFVYNEVVESYNKSKELKKELSQTLSAGHYKAGLADQGEITTKYHTATHLLHQALRLVLGDHVHQAGSNITGERLRFDFTHGEKLFDDQVKQVEEMINQKIQENLAVHRDEMDKDKAIREGALAFFPEKYPQTASVYTIGDLNNYFSKELCGGPHVTSTGQIGKIIISKQEASGSGVRRIYLKLLE